VQAGVNRLDTAATHLGDLHNQASYKASAYSVNVGVSGGKPSGSAGIGQDSGSAASDTRAGISGIAGNSSVRYGTDAWPRHGHAGIQVNATPSVRLA
jgi:filamentous hemagglutinin